MASIGNIGLLRSPPAPPCPEPEAAGVELEALGPPRILALAPGERGQRRGPIEHEGRTHAAELRLDAVEEDLEKDVVPRRRRAGHARRGRLLPQHLRALVAG